MRAFVEGVRKMGVDTIRGYIYADKSMKDSDLAGEGWCWDDDNPVLSPLLIGRKDLFVERFIRELSEAGIVVEANISERQRPDDAFCIVSRFHTIDQVLMKMLKESDNLYAESMFYQLAAATGNRPAKASHAASVIERLITKVGLNPRRYRITTTCLRKWRWRCCAMPSAITTSTCISILRFPKPALTAHCAHA